MRNGYAVDTEGTLTNGVWRCPSFELPMGRNGPVTGPSYGYNCLGIYGKFGLDDFTPRTVGNNVGDIKISSVVDPSDMIAIGDGFCGNASNIIDRTWMMGRILAKKVPTAGATTIRVYARHQGKANMGFCDGHVETPTLQFLFADTSDNSLMRWARDHQPHRELLPP
jgi:prepilin-type processing-associated H-X9-DG protein